MLRARLAAVLLRRAGLCARFPATASPAMAALPALRATAAPSVPAAVFSSAAAPSVPAAVAPTTAAAAPTAPTAAPPAVDLEQILVSVAPANPTPTKAAQRKPPMSELQAASLDRLAAALTKYKHGDAIRIFREMELANSPDLAKISPELFTDIIRIYAFNVRRAPKHMSAKTRTAQALQVYDLMRSLGVEPTQETFAVVINANSHLGNTAAIESLLAEMASKGKDTETPAILTPVVFGYIVAGNEAKGREVFDKLVKLDPSARTYTDLMKAYAASGNEARLLAVFEELKTGGLGASVDAYTHLCNYYSRVGDYGKVVDYCDEFRQNGGEPTRRLWATVLSACNKLGNHAQVMATCRELRAKGVQLNSDLYTEEIVALAAFGDRTAAWKTLEGCVRKTGTNMRMDLAMASMMGPMTTPAAIADLKATIAGTELDETRTILSLMSGYGRLGDVASVKALYADVQSRLSNRLSVLVDAILTRAFETAGDAAGREAFMKEMSAKTVSSSSPSFFSTAAE